MDQSTNTSQLPPKHSTSIYDDNAAADDIKALHHHHPTTTTTTTTLSLSLSLSPNSKSRIIKEAETFVQSQHHHQPSTKLATENHPTTMSMNDNRDTIATRLLKAELTAAESQAQLKEWSAVAEELRGIIKRQQQDMTNQKDMPSQQHHIFNNNNNQNRAPPPAQSSSRPQVLPRIAQLQQLVADMRSDLLATNGTVSNDTTISNNNGAAYNRPRFSSMVAAAAVDTSQPTGSTSSSTSTKRALLDAELDLRKAAQEAEHLRGRLKAAESEIASKDDRLQATEKRAQSALDREAVLQTDMTTLQNQLADAEARAATLIAKNAQNSMKIDQMKARIKQAEACIQEATAAGEAEAGRYKQRLAAAEQSSKKMKARIAELQEEVDAADRKAYLEHAGVVATVRALEHEVAMAQRQGNEAQQEAQRVKRELQALKAKTNSCDASSSSMSIVDVNNKLKAELMEAKKEISDLRAQLEEEKAAVPCYQQELQGLKILLQSVSLAASSKDTDLDEAKGRVRDLETKLALSYDVQHSKMVDREEAAAYTESQMMNLVVKYETEQTEMIEAHDAEVKRMKREMDELKTEVTALYGAKNEAITAGQKEMAELRAGNAVEVESLKLQVVELSSALAAARQKVEDDGIMMAAMERTAERRRRMEEEEEEERRNKAAVIGNHDDDHDLRGRLIAAEAALDEATTRHNKDLATLRTGFEMQLQAQELQYMAELDPFNNDNNNNKWSDVEVQALVMDMDDRHNKSIVAVFTAGVMRSALLRRELEDMVEMDLMAASTGIAAAMKKNKKHCVDGIEEDEDGVRRKLYGDGTTTINQQQASSDGGGGGGVLNIKTPGGTMRQITVDMALQAAMHAEQEIERLESLLSEARQESERRGDLIVQVQDMVAELQEYEGQRIHQIKQLTVQLHDEQSRVAMYETRLMEYQELNAALEAHLTQMEKERGILIMELKQQHEEKEREEEEEANLNQRQYEDKAVGRDIDDYADADNADNEEEERIEQEEVMGDMSKEKKKTTKKAGGAIRRFGQMINNKLSGGSSSSNNNSRQTSPSKKEKQRTKEIINNPMAPLQASIELKKEEERWADDLVKHWELSQGVKRVHWREENIGEGGGRPGSGGQLSEVPEDEEGRYVDVDDDRIMHSNSLYVMYDENSRYK